MWCWHRQGWELRWAAAAGLELAGRAAARDQAAQGDGHPAPALPDPVPADGDHSPKVLTPHAQQHHHMRVCLCDLAVRLPQKFPHRSCHLPCSAGAAWKACVSPPEWEGAHACWQYPSTICQLQGLTVMHSVTCQKILHRYMIQTCSGLMQGHPVPWGARDGENAGGASAGGRVREAVAQAGGLLLAQGGGLPGQVQRGGGAHAAPALRGGGPILDILGHQHKNCVLLGVTAPENTAGKQQWWAYSGCPGPVT